MCQTGRLLCRSVGPCNPIRPALRVAWSGFFQQPSPRAHVAGSGVPRVRRSEPLRPVGRASRGLGHRRRTVASRTRQSGNEAWRARRVVASAPHAQFLSTPEVRCREFLPGRSQASAWMRLTGAYPVHFSRHARRRLSRSAREEAPQVSAEAECPAVCRLLCCLWRVVDVGYDLISGTAYPVVGANGDDVRSDMG